MTSYRIIDELTCEEDENNLENILQMDRLIEEKKKQIRITNQSRPLDRKLSESIVAVESFLKCRKFIQITKRERTVQRLNSELLSAIENGDVVSFNNTIIEGADINATCIKGGMSTCHVAVIFDKCDLLVELINKGANFMATTWQNGYLPVHLAAYVGCETCLKTLVEHRPQNLSEQTTNDSNQPDGNILMLDSWVHEHNVVQSKIPQIAPGSTPLHIACKQLHVKCVEYLLSQNPNLEITDQRKRTALDVVNENIVKMKTEKFKGLELNDSKLGSRGTINSKMMQSFASSLVSITSDESKFCTNIIAIICKLIDAGANISISEENMRNCTTLLHTAVITHNDTLLKILLKKHVDLTVRNELGDIPLHMAIRNRTKKCLIMLLSWDEKKNTIEMRDYENKTPLQIAICTGWNYGVCLMMEAAANCRLVTDDGNNVLHLAAIVENSCVLAQLLSCTEMTQFVNMKNINEETPLMLAVLHGNLSCVKKLIKFNSDLRITGKNNRTLVHAAAEKGHADILQVLLNIDPVLVHAKTDDGETALHLACLNGHLKCVQLLLSKGCDINSKTMKIHDKKTMRSITSIAENCDFSGTPLHCAAWKGRLSVIQYLIEQNSGLVNEPNINGWYPLHIAAYFNHIECAECIIKNGGNLFRKVLYFDGAYKTALHIILYSFADSISFFESIFDSYIFTNNLPLNHPECLVTFNFDVFTPCGEDRKQMKVLNALLNTETDNLQTTLLLHPLTETFLHLKWKKLSKIFVVITILHTIFTFSLTSFALLVRYENMENWEAVPVFIMLISLVLLSLQEILHASKLQRYYINDLESWIKWSTFLTAFIVSIGGINSMFNQYADTRWKNIMAIPVLLSWIEILFLLSRFPVWGFYVLMFFRVTSNVIKVFCTFASLILGFVFSFYILFKSDETEFYSIWETFIKVIAMMSEFNYSETFKTPPEMDHSETPVYQIVSRLVFLLFVVLIAIVLMNLMIGLAVSDISILEAQGKSQRLAKQIDFLHLLETFVYSETILKWLPDGFQDHVKKNRKVSTSFSFYPGKPYGSQFHKLPCDLKITIMKYLLEKKAKPEFYNKSPKPEKKSYDGKTLSDRLLIISDELDAIKREFYERTS